MVNQLSDLRTLYEQVILRHAKSPQGLNLRIQATHSGSADNPFCGDEVTVAARIEDEVIRETAYCGEFCAVCSASASLLCEHSVGMGVEEFKSFTTRVLAGLDGQTPGPRIPEDLQALLEVRRFPVRIKCAALPWQAARLAMHAVAETG